MTAAQTTALQRLKKASAHGAGGNFRLSENSEGLRYNDQSVYPRAKASGALFAPARVTHSGSGASFFTPPISLGKHAKLAQLYGFLHSLDLQSGRAG